jgi:RimJ/RimL family protein N-acetyltransferase
MGSTRLYQWANDRPDLELRPSDWVNDPAIIASNDRMVSINTALAMDLTGQVAADTLDGQFYSGIGGQVDFVRGAARSRQGRSLIVLPSLARGGALSRIQAVLPAGSAVVTSRGDVRYVVTEYGIADLWGKSVRERALALICIAHPDHRSELMAAAKQRRWILPDQPPVRTPFEARVWHEQLPGGEEIVIRAARATDEQQVQDVLYDMSPESAYQRYFTPRRIHSRSEVLAFLDADPRSSCALVAEEAGSGRLVGIARYELDPSSKMGDLGIVVRDDFQRRGVGTALVRHLIEVGDIHGMRGLRADVLATNVGMMALLRRSGLHDTPMPEAGVYSVEVLSPRARGAATAAVASGQQHD